MSGCAVTFSERPVREGVGDNGKAGTTEGAGTMRVSQRQKCQTTPHATRTGRRGQPAEQAAGSGRHTAESRKQAAGDGQQAAGGTRQKAGGGRAVIRRAGGSIAHREDFMYIQTARNGRTMHTPARRQPRAQGIGDRFGTVQTRLRQKSCRQTGTIHRDTGNPPNKGNTADVHKLS